jgi:hypothetical protein
MPVYTVFWSLHWVLYNRKNDNKHTTKKEFEHVMLYRWRNTARHLFQRMEDVLAECGLRYHIPNHWPN